MDRIILCHKDLNHSLTLFLSANDFLDPTIIVSDRLFVKQISTFTIFLWTVNNFFTLNSNCILTYFMVHYLRYTALCKGGRD